MKIVADENILGVDVFSQYGDLTLLPGRDITANCLVDADALLVRSVTKVNKSLLESSNVSFVASATSGFDHVDEQWLQQSDIKFHYAPGCNSRSVVDYVLAALSEIHVKYGISWLEKSIGILGAGNIGGLLADVLKNIGVRFTIYDPYLGKSFRHADSLVGFKDVIKSDILTLHIPLTFDCDYPSFHMFSNSVINMLKPGTILINAARGELIDNHALLERLKRKNDIYCVLDTWENEPNPDLELLAMVAIGSPHIAGYSKEGKANGTLQILKAFCNHFKCTCQIPQSINDVPVEIITQTSAIDFGLMLSKIISNAYEIKRDHESMQQLLKPEQAHITFDLLRKSYPVRYEFSHFSFSQSTMDDELGQTLGALGFTPA